MSAVSPTFQEFLQPSDASPGPATPCSGSSSSEAFFDAVTQLSVTPNHDSGREHFHDVPDTPASNVNICIEDYKATHGLTERGIFCDTDANSRFPAVNVSESQEDEKPKARRFLMDFLPQKETGTNLSEETRKIVQMLSNDKTCKIDRPSLGLQDRLQSLVQRSAGKRTSYVKGPRVCSSLVKMIVKRTQDTLHVRRGSIQYNNKQEDKPLPTLNKPIPSYIKPPKHTKTSEAIDTLSTRTNQVNNVNGFEMVIKRRKKDNEKTDSTTSAGVSTSPNPTVDVSQVTSKITPHLTTTPTTQVITTTPQVTTATPYVSAQHTAQNQLDLHIEEQTGNTHEGENVHTTKTIDLNQDAHDSDRRSLINIEFKISVPYRSQSQDTPDCTNHRPSFPNILDDNDDDDDDSDYDYDDDDSGDYDASPANEMEITPEKYNGTVSCNPEYNEVKIPKMKEATLTPQDPQDKQDVPSIKLTNGHTEQTVNLTNGHTEQTVNLTNGHTEQTNLSAPKSGNKMPPLHPGSAPQPPRHSLTNSDVDLQKHIASLNKVSLKFSMKNKEHKSDVKRVAASPEQHSTPPTTRPSAKQGARVTGGRGGFCMATAKENSSLPIYKGGEAMLRPLSYSNTTQGSISTRDLLYTDEEAQQTSALPQSPLHIDTLMRLKTDNLVARHGGKKTHVQPYPASSRQTTPTPPPAQEDTPESIPVLETLPPIPPKEDPGATSPPVIQVDRKRSRASVHWTRSRNASLEHPCLGSKKPSFSQDMLRKCLIAAVDQCYNTDWEEPCNSEVVKDDQMSEEELRKAMIKAVSRHDAGKVRMLLKLGVDPNIKCGHTPALLRTTREGALYVMQALLAAGADVDARTDMGNSPLHLAARGGYGEAVVQLVHSGAFVDAINRSGVTPLQMALAYGHLEVAHSLLRLKADIFLQNKVGESAYDVANELGYIELSGAPREFRRESGAGTRVELPSCDIPVAVKMIQGIEAGCAGTVDDCLREGASPNTLLPLALHWPARASVLHRAAHHGHDLIVRLLLVAGANIVIRDVVGNTPLHVATQAGHNRVVKILLEYGAPKEAVSQSGMTPLHRAASKGKELTCNLLMRRGSNRRAEDSSGRTPADWARKRGFKHLSQKLMYRRKSSNTLLAEEDEKQCLEHLHRLHDAALKAPLQSPEPMECEE